MSEHTPPHKHVWIKSVFHIWCRDCPARLTEAERAVLEAANYVAEGRGLGDGHPLFAAVEQILAARTSTATADTDESWRREVCRDDPCRPGYCPTTKPTCAGRRPAATADTGARDE